MRVPPYGKQFQTIPRSGVQVVLGGDAWEIAARHRYPVMVLPEHEAPSSFTWPSGEGPALVFECGEANDERLWALAEALLIAGSKSVVALR